MSQHDFNIANQGFPATRADINNAFQAIASNSSGPTAPSTTYANQFWYDTTNNLLKFRNEADSAWITLAYLDQATNEWEIRSAVIQAVDSAGVIIKTDDGTARVTVADDGDVTFANDVIVDSGDFFVGLTSQEAVGTNAGTQLRSDGLVYAAATSDAHILSRRTTDGAILNFRKDTTTVGSIGNQGSSLYLASGSTAVKVIADNTIRPSDGSGGNKDAQIDLGAAASRFKDLYLSGGVYLGGTGAANKLDDYEEGSWTPYLGGTSSDPTITYTSQTGKYVKVGTMVTLHGKIGWSAKSAGSGYLKLAGFPFNGDHAGTEPSVNFNYTSGFGTTSAPVQGGMVHGNNWAYVYRHNTADSRSPIGTGLLTSDLGSSGALYFTITYRSV